MKEYHFSANEEEKLEKIPSLYLTFLISCEPVIKTASNFTDILVWKSKSKSFIVLLLWITLCQWTRAWMIFGLPCLVIVQHIVEWFNMKILHKRRQIKEHVIITKDLNVSIGQQDSSIQKINLNDMLDHLKKVQLFWANYNSFPVELPIYLYAYTWIVWALFNCCFPSNSVICFLGCWLLIYHSPFYRFVMYTLKNNVYLYSVAQAVADYHVAFFHYLFTADEKPVMTYLTPTPSSRSPLSCHDCSKPRELYRCEIPVIIEIYENERWWLGLNWTKELLSTERDPWTDNQFKPVISKEKYQLPNDKITTSENERKSTIKTWVWIDRNWWIDMTGELEDKVDPNGWTYCDNKWQHAMNIPGPHSFTRQRRWCKRAKIIEKQILYVH